ncbi:hypothetical protein [Roseivirga thermotolerans]|uniref:Uncharacterized protein n=1 Tax=Roseivirga thermotolerans TaxID=1758176 RepID=A0ABQ3IB39_9BACT|nr:hypothetical protein [Roseivirga thermotolerans]GHE71369.1 hypothetical protein GCM10011340_29160 [Roseivirga thermotolerans]
MNLIQQQANDFISTNSDYPWEHKKFIQDVRSELYEYRKDSYKLEFLNHLVNKAKTDYDEHLKICTASKIEECPTNQFFENALFFLQEEIEDIEDSLDPAEFSRYEKEQLSKAITEILAELKKIQVGQQITYDDISDQLIELKDFYFLNKKNWTQLFLGKMTEMIASGVVSESISKELVELIKTNYPTLFGQ